MIEQMVVRERNGVRQHKSAEVEEKEEEVAQAREVEVVGEEGLALHKDSVTRCLDKLSEGDDMSSTT